MAKDYNITQSILIKKKSFSVRLTPILVFFGPLVTSLALLLAVTIGGDTTPDWLNWILLITMVPMILTSLIIGQRKKLVGAYGETILLLIPTFVWLLPGHPQALKYMIIASFAIIMIGLVVYLSAYIVKYLRFKNNENRLKLMEVLLRIGFIASAVTSTVIVSIVLINWADFTMKMAQVTDITGTHNDYTVSGWIFFISVTTILVALTLVLLGIISGAKKNMDQTLGEKKHSHRFASSKEKGPKIKTRKSDKTVIIDLSKKRKRK